MQRGAATTMGEVNTQRYMKELNLSGFLSVLRPPPAHCCSVHGANLILVVFKTNWEDRYVLR